MIDFQLKINEHPVVIVFVPDNIVFYCPSRRALPTFEESIPSSRVFKVFRKRLVDTLFLFVFVSINSEFDHLHLPAPKLRTLDREHKRFGKWVSETDTATWTSGASWYHFLKCIMNPYNFCFSRPTFIITNFTFLCVIKWISTGQKTLS